MRRMIPLAFFLLAACGGGARSTDAVNPDPDMRAASRSQASPAIVLDWNAIAADVIVTQNARQPFTSYYYLAMIHVATYDAVNAIGGTGGRYQPLVVTLGEREGASREAAAISAAYQTLIGLPLTQASKDYATGKYNEALAAIKDGTHKTNGIAVGAEVATALLAAYPAAIPPSTYTLLPPGPGVWEPVPPSFGIAAPGFARMKPFLMARPSQFRLGPPPALTSATYTADLNEVKYYGALVNSLRTPEQTDTAYIYAYESGALVYTRALRRICEENNLSFLDNVRLAAMWWTGAADSQIFAWDTKYYYSFWRPLTAITRADTDGNDLTDVDTTWLPSTPTPGHPEYPSAHSAFTGAFTEVLRQFFQTDHVHLVLESTLPLLPGAHPVYKSFDNLTQVDSDVVDGRVFAGIHFRNSNVVAIEAGHQMIQSQLDQHFRRCDNCD